MWDWINSDILYLHQISIWRITINGVTKYYYVTNATKAKIEIEDVTVGGVAADCIYSYIPR